MTLPFVLAAAGAVAAAVLAAGLIEELSVAEVEVAFEEDGIEFASADADGLQLILSGTAPTEAWRFRALAAAGKAVDAARIVDAMGVAEASTLEAPRFGLEILRSADGVSLIGLVPAGTNRDRIVGALERATDATVSDFMETADHEPPAGWDRALAFALDVTGRLPRAKLSVDGERVLITTAVESFDEKARTERSLRAAVPDGLRLILSVTAPRPVIAPFTLRFVEEGGTARFDACSAGSPEEAERLRAAARAAGAGGPDCRVGLGSPSPRWGDAGAAVIDAVARLPMGGTVTMTDSDVSFTAHPETPGPLFDEVAGALREALPPEFALAATLPDADGTEQGEAELVATRSPEGEIQIRGALPASARETVGAFARSRFGTDSVYLGTAPHSDLPSDWTMRVLTGLEALSILDSGTLTIDEGQISLRGRTGDRAGSETVSGLFATRLGPRETVQLAVAYDEALDPVQALPTVEECIAGIQAANAARKITFAPGSDRIEPAGLRTVGEIATILEGCPEMRIEVAAHSDSQGREQMNLDLSQSRAQAVVDALAARRVLVSGLTAKGYGEARPIADNGTEAGREANRRIEFTLVAGAPE